ncbi:extracellular solute-binding protein [Bacillaceae bacterium SIJ1]|uniref:extracellular solute-binding protein n=1 Tax=Litoribacterium kuwaitense TaxID=1398745 RepID=UPI0013EB14B7|nr:extracellular solute-binding protein [Litoribacterium kuwaitense]NGP46516.1 extracellular solute-binding protein [Litoribacterium kuwaitense]
MSRNSGIKMWLLRSTILFIIILGACTNEASIEENTSSDSEEAGPVQLSVFAPQGPEDDLETNEISTLMEEKFNIDFTWETTTYDSSSANEKRQISLASGDYPDAYMLIPWVDHFSKDELLKYGQQGVLIPLNELIEEHAPNIQKAFEEEPEFKAMATAPDGQIYGIPQWNDCYHCTFPDKLWINTEWLDTLNLEMPTTPEELKEVFIAFKNDDPNGNGKADEIPLSGSNLDAVTYMMNAFEYYHSDGIPLLLNDGDISIAAKTEGWRAGLSYMAELYELGLIDPGMFTQNGDALIQIGNNAEAMILGAGPGFPSIFTNDEERLYSDIYEPIPPLEGQESYATYSFSSQPGAAFVLTNKASEAAQVAAVKMVDHLFTIDGMLTAHFGPEGIGWRKPKEGDIALNEQVDPIYKQLPENPGEEKEPNVSWGAMGQYWHYRGLRDAEVQGTDIYSRSGYERRLQEATLLYDGHQPSENELFPYWKVWIDPSVATELAMLKTNIADYIEQNMVQFISGAKDIDSEWDAYIQGFDQMNESRYLEMMQDAYDEVAK